MPVYEFECRSCGPFTEIRSIIESGSPAKCPDCGTISAKIFPVVNLRQMRPENRVAWERNEQSAHAPRYSPTCSHKTSGAKPGADGRPALQSSKKRNSRPWMLGH